MKLLLDENVEAYVATHLREQGYELVQVGDFAAGAPDEDVLRHADTGASLLLTYDKDFGELVYKRGQSNSGVLLLRIGGLRKFQKVSLISSTLRDHGDALQGGFAVLTPRSLRIREGS